MTITANDRRKPYVGNGLADTFNGPRAFRASDIQVFTGTHPNYNLIPSSAYTISGIGSKNTKVKFDTPPAVNIDILLLRTVPMDQDTSITNQGAFLPEIHENAFDKRVMQIQQLEDGSIQQVFEDGQFVWDAKHSRIVRVGDASAMTDAMNMQSTLTLIEQVQLGGGVVGVQPQKWDLLAEDADQTDFYLAGAGVDNPLLYLVHLGGGLLEPVDQFRVLAGNSLADRVLRVSTPVAAGTAGFVVLWGYARPYVGPQPITTVAPRIVTDITGDATLGGDYQNTLIVINEAADVTLTLRENTGHPTLDWEDGEGFSVLQLGTGQVILAAAGGGTIVPSPGFDPRTRGVGSIISATCYFPDADAWAASGDLRRTTAAPIKQSFVVAASDESTNLTTGNGKVTFRMPYGFLLSDVRASLTVGQSAGVILTIDINRNGTSILSTKLTFDNAEKTTVTASTPPVFASGGDVLYDDDEISIDIDQVGTAGAKGLKVSLIGSPAS